MICNIAELLYAFMQTQASKLDAEVLTHGPTIGAMYEGLTHQILDRSIPKNLGVKVVEGFVEGSDGRLSPQIDALIVAGECRPVPNTNSQICQIGNVIAAIEVKKNLYSNNLDDSLEKMRIITKMSSTYLQDGGHSSADLTPAYQAFAMVTGQYPQSRNDIDLLSENLSHIFHAIVVEQLCPVRAIIGFHGFSSEDGLRQGLVGILETKLIEDSYGVLSLPNLIACPGRALLKANGHPYASAISDSWWPVMTSNNENPLRLLIEIFWSRLINLFDLELEMDDSLQQERLAPFIDARIANIGGKIGWEMKYIDLSKKQLESSKNLSWEPSSISRCEFTILFSFAKQTELDLLDGDFRKYAAENGFDPEIMIGKLVDRRLLAWCGKDKVCLISKAPIIAAFLPDGRELYANRLALFGMWLEKNL